MFRSIIFQEVIKKNKRAWKEAEKHHLNLLTSLKNGKTRLKVRSLGLVQICFTLQPKKEEGSNLGLHFKYIVVTK
jgi:hypothetical protein